MLREYSGIAEIYDHLMSGIEFDDWADYTEEILSVFDYKPVTVLDLACGTGNTIIPMARRGYRTRGTDISKEMIRLAYKKAQRENLNIEFAVEDMREFSVDGGFDLVTCFHDGLNYLTDIRDVESTFRSVRACLNPGGMFIFDLNAVSWLAQGRGDTQVGFLDDEKMTLIWESDYREEDGIWDIRLTAFLAKGGLYKKVTERHREKAYGLREIKKTLTDADLELLAVYNAFTLDPAEPGNRRYFFVARKAN